MSENGNEVERVCAGKMETDFVAFMKDLEGVINGHSIENESNTPDFILADFLIKCLKAFEGASNRREGWFGVKLDILNGWEELINTAIGEASMCWSETPKGVFDSTKALEIGKKLLEDLKGK